MVAAWSQLMACSIFAIYLDLQMCHVDIHEKWFIAFFSFYVTLTSISVLLGLNDTYVLQEVNVFDFSTHDGTAIAYAVLRALAEKVRCRAFFSTHYHSLCNAVRDVPNIKAAHMVSFPFCHFLLCLKVDELIVFECYDENQRRRGGLIDFNLVPTN